MPQRLLIAILLTLPLPALAQDDRPRLWRHESSACQVKSDGGARARLSVLRAGKIIYKPECDCEVNVRFSRSGKYIAFTNGESGYFCVGRTKKEFRLVVLNCETGRAKGYIAPAADAARSWITIQGWTRDEKQMNISDDMSDVPPQSIDLVFEGENSLP